MRIVVLESHFHCCPGGEKKDLNGYELILGEPGSVLSLAKLNFTLRCFMFSKTQNIF